MSTTFFFFLFLFVPLSAIYYLTAAYSLEDCHELLYLTKPNECHYKRMIHWFSFIKPNTKNSLHGLYHMHKYASM
ncbi:hypothetical protein F4779DRAFT_471878 [Xylariaceae sp. FL0662B]|nr:hypothetical protein F4779DRAFT_471878 [Xylariaceae sp. FL0662B]